MLMTVLKSLTMSHVSLQMIQNVIILEYCKSLLESAVLRAPPYREVSVRVQVSTVRTAAESLSCSRALKQGDFLLLCSQ